MKRRFCSVSIVMLIAPIFVYIFSAKELLERVPFAEILGLRLQGLALASIVPYLLTALLFFGPLCVQMQNDSFRVFLGKLKII